MFASYFGGAEESNAAAADENSGKPIILITGVTGFIGAQLLNHCLDVGKDIASEY